LSPASSRPIVPGADRGAVSSARDRHAARARLMASKGARIRRYQRQRIPPSSITIG
jgi:hypothetical protein